MLPNMRIVVLVSVLLSFSSSVFATCWFPDGQESTLDTACDPNAIVSSCCFDRQACLSNGLCVADPHNPEKSRTYRGTCTDRGWKSGNCVRQCFDNMHAGAPVYACNVTDVDSYCCYENCKCENPFEVFSFPEPPSAISTKTIILEKFTPVPSAASKGSATLPASASASATGSAASHQGSQNYLALGIGLGLGLGLGIPLIFFAGFCIWRRKQAGDRPANNRAKPSEFNENYYPLQSKHEYAHEAPRALEPAPANEILPAEKDLAIQHLVELPDRQSKTLTPPPPTHTGIDKKL